MGGKEKSRRGNVGSGVPRTGTSLSLSQTDGKFTVAVFAVMFLVMWLSDWVRWWLS